MRANKADDRRTKKNQPIFSAKLEPSSTAEFIADKMGRFYRSSVIGLRLQVSVCSGYDFVGRWLTS